MKEIFNWICNNQEWIFSGIGVSITIFVLSIFLKKNNGINQKAKSGNNSQITQVGHDYTIKNKDNEPES